MAEAEMEAELLAFNFSDSEAEVGETAREVRIRQAVEQSKTYVAHRDVPYWFARPPDKQVEQMCSLRRAGPEVEWAIASLYARGMYSAAYALAVQALRMQNLVYSAPAGCRTEVLRTPSRKPNMPRLASKVNTREALDTALRSACRMVRAGAPPPEEDCIALLLLAKDEAMGWFPAQEWERAVPPDYFPPPTQQDHWSAHPGLIASAGDLSLALSRESEATGMYALSLAARPEQWRVWLMLLRSLLSLDMRAFSRASACATCFSAPPTIRAQLAHTLIQRLNDAGFLGQSAAVPSSQPESERTLPYPIWHVLVHGAFAGRVRDVSFLDAAPCEKLLQWYASSHGECDSTEANFRSVRSL